MLEVTIALCPPNGERSVLATAKVENMCDPSKDDVCADRGNYRITLKHDGKTTEALTLAFRKERGPIALVGELLAMVTGARLR